MKRFLIILTVFIFVFLIGCGKTVDDSDSSSSSPPVIPSDESSSETESFSEPEVDPVVNESAKGCFYGDNTGTDKTYTGLEPLPLSDFNDPSFVNSKGLSDKTVDHSFGVAKNEQPHDISVNNQKLFDEKGFNAIAYDNKTDEKILYLTFDCGYENGYTAKILDTLRDKGVKAAFFCTLPEMKQNTEIIARMINEGHIVGNHSVTHPDFSGLTRQQMYDEVKGFDDYIRENFGYSAQYFRYPQGKYSENSLDMLNEMGYTCVFWSLAYADWDLNNQKGANNALETVIGRIHPGAVILLHSVSPDNANALADIIDTARNMGYEFRSLPEYRN
ncbi:MAG: polysaccharide deacetylase family protein [Oscillospiraceae bacterium]|nr:polysaccharide deacetylase family protein [Oscillospiraceae bacterium]